MLYRSTRFRANATPVEMSPTEPNHRQDELLDALVTAAALVARADNWVQPVECGQLLDFLDRKHFLSIFTRAEILDAFEQCVRELRQPGGRGAALQRLRRHAESPPARLITEIGKEIAHADCRLDPREEHILSLIRDLLRAAPSSPAPRDNRTDRTR